MIEPVRKAIESLPKDYQYTVRRQSKDNSVAVRISLPGTTKAITVYFWFSPIDQRWLVSFKDKTGFKEGKGLIPPEADYVLPFLELAISKL